MSPVTFEDVLAARDRIAGAVYRSPTNYSLQLSRLCGCEVFCKLDHLQITGSFKERGACNRLMQLDDSQRPAGVIAASAGNHALALAYHGSRLGIPVTVVMPKWAPIVKVSNCRSFGAEIVLHGESFDEARAHAYALRDARGMTYVHGFDDPAVIAGAGTVALELLEDVKDLDAVMIPVGGGGLLAGCALAIKKLQPGVRIIGVEAERAPTLAESRKAGRVVRIDAKATLADGLAIAEVGKLCFDIANPRVDDLVLVSERSIAMAVLRMMEMEKTVVEGAGAAPLAALMEHSLGLEGKRVALLVCGGNIDMTVVSKVIERGLVADGRLCRFTVRISDRPGGLAQLTRLLADAGASIKEVFHDRTFSPGEVGTVVVTVLLETRDATHAREVESTLISRGIEIVR